MSAVWYGVVQLLVLFCCVCASEFCPENSRYESFDFSELASETFQFQPALGINSFSSSWHFLKFRLAQLRCSYTVKFFLPRSKNVFLTGLTKTDNPIETSKVGIFQVKFGNTTRTLIGLCLWMRGSFQFSSPDPSGTRPADQDMLIFHEVFLADQRTMNSKQPWLRTTHSNFLGELYLYMFWRGSFHNHTRLIWAIFRLLPCCSILDHLFLTFISFGVQYCAPHTVPRNILKFSLFAGLVSFIIKSCFDLSFSFWPTWFIFL